MGLNFVLRIWTLFHTQCLTQLGGFVPLSREFFFVSLKTNCHFFFIVTANNLLHLNSSYEI